jgi:glucose-6-phosphate isomerase
MGMMNSKQKSGLDFTLGTNELVYNQNAHSTGVNWVKSFDDGKYAYNNPADGPAILYYGVRYMESDHNEVTFVENDIMADLTVINPGFVGDEYIKTVGHYHGNVPDADIAYPEVYENISGGLEYLLQSELDGAYVNVLWVLTEPGDKIVMPPGWGHVSMNVSGLPAVEIDIQKRDNPKNSDYSIFKDRQGGAVYRTKKGLVRNPHYLIGSLRVVRPKEQPQWHLRKNTPLYKSFVQNAEDFKFLTNPQDFSFDINELFEDVTPLPFEVNI